MRSTALVAAVLALGGGGITVTTLPRPAFPGPVAGAPAAKRLVLVSSRYRNPGAGTGEIFSIPTTASLTFRGAVLVGAARQAGKTFAFYGTDFTARYLLAFSGRDFAYGFDFGNYAWPPRIAPGEREFVFEQVVWAREANGVLYVENAHSTYAGSAATPTSRRST
jgi:hypothetical protein